MYRHTFACGCKAEYHYANQFGVDGLDVTLICFKHMEYLVRSALNKLTPLPGQEAYFEELVEELTA